MGSSATDSPFAVTTMDELRLYRERGFSAARSGVRLSVSGLDPQAADEIGARLTQFARECGCTLGAWMMSAAGLTALAGLAALYRPFSFEFVLASPLALIALMVGAGVGKLAGIRIAAVRWRRLIKRLVTAGTSAAPRHSVSWQG
jgi:hypothetical protein